MKRYSLAYLAGFVKENMRLTVGTFVTRNADFSSETDLMSRASMQSGAANGLISKLFQPPPHLQPSTPTPPRVS